MFKRVGDPHDCGHSDLRVSSHKMTAIVQEDNELKKLLGSPAKNAGEDNLMGPPQTVN